MASMDQVVSILKGLGNQCGIAQKGKEICPLLQWMQRWGFADSPSNWLERRTLEKVEEELWAVDCNGNKEALGLIPAFMKILKTFKQVREQHSIWQLAACWELAYRTWTCARGAIVQFELALSNQG